MQSDTQSHAISVSDSIVLKGVRVNNLKNLTLAIPRGKLVVITGLSGSGKSSLAFDTLYAEGQRRYVESLSAYARQFLSRMAKPDCDYIKGIPPAVAISQRVTTRNPRSTVGTVTEIYDYLVMLFARIGHTFSPVSGQEVKKHTVEDVLAYVNQLPAGEKVALVVQMNVPEGRTLAEHLEMLVKNGFARAEQSGKFVRLQEVEAAPFNLVIDRFQTPVAEHEQSRLADSIETAFYEGGGELLLKTWGTETLSERLFSQRFEADGLQFTEPTDHFFHFNSPIGACPECEGFGHVIGVSEELVVPNKSLSLYEDAVAPWRGEKMSAWKYDFVRHSADFVLRNGEPFHIHRPYYQLTDEERDLLWNGQPATVALQGKDVYGIRDFFAMVEENSYKIQYRVMLSRYRGTTLCPVCHGTRLHKEVEYVKVGGRSITELVAMPVSELSAFFAALVVSEHEATIARRLLLEIKQRLEFLQEVGLSYLTLSRPANTLSGGESQRIHLSTALASSLVGSMYILDEPSIGLHTRDTDNLLRVLRHLASLGNTVIVVEHDEAIIRAADYLIDVGPAAGRLGGEVVYTGSPEALLTADENVLQRSYTARYLTGALRVEVPSSVRPWSSYILIKGAVENNLKEVTAHIPLGVMTVVTGVSGSGKSTLVGNILYRGMLRYLGEPTDPPGAFQGFEGDMARIRRVSFVDQNPIGKSTRSNAATYLKAFDEIRELFALQPLAAQLGFKAATFSFNVEGGRCPECKGEGTITVEMQFMSDITMTCEACHGQRFNKDVLEVCFKGKNIAEVLDMTVDEAVEFFTLEEENSAEGVKPLFSAAMRRASAAVVRRLLPLQDVGLGYIKLGQSSSTLSGGENQRVKLAAFLVAEVTEDLPTLFIFDEPTTGLHLHDVNVLLRALGKLLEKGHTLVIIEHNLDVIKCADHIIDLGLEGGAAGGHLLFEGTPRALCTSGIQSYTAAALRPKFQL